MNPDRKYKVLILEDDEIWSSAMQMCFNESSDFKVILATNSCSKAIECVKISHPDVAIVDLQLNERGSEGDGFIFLTHINNPQEKIPVQPYKLAITNITSQKTLSWLNNGKTDNVIHKQMLIGNPEPILLHLRMMSDVFDCNLNKEMPIQCQYNKEDKIRNRVIAELDNYYIKQSNMGNDFLIDAICMVVDMPHKPLMSKTIYPTIGRKYKKDRHSVEIAIERVIANAFAKTDQEDLKKLYPPFVDITRGAPANKEFIVYVANKIKAELFAVS